MRLLLDEQMSAVAASALSALAAARGSTVNHIVAIGHGGAQDDDIPELCRTNDYAALITINVKDFGARLHYYTALIAAGVHVGVVRPGKLRMDDGGQVGILAPRLGQMIALWSESNSPLLIKVTHGGIQVRSLEELAEEIEGHRLGP